ncbi:hypothetical protein SASPL_157444 [Salvia splendens]|uniref:Uncharacterized protein n=1 Tax=Salvia splendens TaxID=180675 RepID=A0A8X8VUX5_SALSN|nr:hypothetical protein SASPL_157444 [Salvia splendens]
MDTIVPETPPDWVDDDEIGHQFGVHGVPPFIGDDEVEGPKPPDLFFYGSETEAPSNGFNGSETEAPSKALDGSETEAPSKGFDGSETTDPSEGFYGSETLPPSPLIDGSETLPPVVVFDESETQPPSQPFDWLPNRAEDSSFYQFPKFHQEGKANKWGVGKGLSFRGRSCPTKDSAEEADANPPAAQVGRNSPTKATRQGPNGDAARPYERAYQTYQRCYGDSLGEFLAHYQRLWWDVAFHGSVTGYDGIVRLLSLLPDGWREWATMVADKYIITAYPAYDLVGDFPRFLLEVFTRFVCYGSVSPLLIDSPAPEVQDPLAPREPGRPSQWESDAGPSRRPVGSTTPRAPPARTPSMRDPTFPIEAEREAQEAARKGKAPAADSEEDKEEGPPVVAPVGSSCLQAITVPSSYSHIRSATEAVHPDMGRRMVRVDDIWPQLRKDGNEAVPPALTEESREDPHLLWEWACGEDENNPILVNSDEKRGPKRESSPYSDSDSDSDDIQDCGYYTPSGKWGLSFRGRSCPTKDSAEEADANPPAAQVGRNSPTKATRQGPNGDAARPVSAEAASRRRQRGNGMQRAGATRSSNPYTTQAATPLERHG